MERWRVKADRAELLWPSGRSKEMTVGTEEFSDMSDEDDVHAVNCTKYGITKT
jgi:hypothetical protein